MIKYVNTQLGFREFPDEVALLINISNCPNNCLGCHSSYLAQDIGEILDERTLDNLINEYSGVTCIGFMGGDNDHLTLAKLFKYVKQKYGLKVGWYSGKDYKFEIIDDLYKVYNIPNQHYIDFLKIGPYKKECGPLDSKTTNQTYFKNTGLSSNPSIMIAEDETNKFWRND